MTLYTDTFSTPLGLFSVAVDATGAVVATAFGDASALRHRLAVCHALRDKPGAAPGVCHLVDDKRRTAAARRQVGEYFAGKRRQFDLPLAPRGTRFQQQVWTALPRIPYGATTTYGLLAAKLKRPRAARAVGRANATNPICLIVPCHRVIGADGSLTGFAFGEEIKGRLLHHEGASRAALA